MTPEERKRLAKQAGVGAAVGAAVGWVAWKLTQGGPDVRPGSSSQLTTTCDAGSESADISAAASDAASCQITFPADKTARDAYILDKVRKGDWYVEWVPIKSRVGGMEATFWVTADAVKIDGVRVTVDARLEQQMADIMGAMLLTPKLADLIFQQADIRLPPLPMPISSTTAAMTSQSAKVDKAIADRVGSLDAAKGKLVSTVGKHWVVTNELGKAPVGKAQNYGWHFVGTMAGVPNETAASGLKDLTTGQPIKVIQGPWMAHDYAHTDYSQNVVLVAKKALLNGQPTTVADILSDPTTAPLASHQGVVSTLRQPGVADATLIS